MTRVNKTICGEYRNIEGGVRESVRERGRGNGRETQKRGVLVNIIVTSIYIALYHVFTLALYTLKKI